MLSMFCAGYNLAEILIRKQKKVRTILCCKKSIPFKVPVPPQV